jgi:hypothetical protein
VQAFLFILCLGLARAETPPPATGKEAKPTIDHLCGPLPVRSLRWTPKQGPLHVTGTVVVGPGRKLELAAGTQVLIEPGNLCSDSAKPDEGTAFSVEGGTFLVQGVPGRPVVFRPGTAGTSLAWEGIRVLGAREGTVDLSWTEVHRAQVGVTFATGTGWIRHAALEDCGIGVAALNGATPWIHHCAFGRSVASDIVSSRSAPFIQSCLFLDGNGDAIRFEGVGLARVETSCFWGHRGAALVRGPAGLGGWKNDTTPDRFGNWHRDPILRGSPLDQALTERRRKELSNAPWWKPRRLPDNPPGSGPWALSAFSPLLEKGDSRRGAHSDIGLWGGR